MVRTGVLATVLAVVAVEAVGDAFTDRWLARRDAHVDARASRAAEAALARGRSDGRAALTGRTFDVDGREVLTRPFAPTAPAWPPDERPHGWDVRTIVRPAPDALDDDMPRSIALEVALERRWYERWTSDPLVLDLLDVPVFVLVALLAAYLIRRGTDRALEPAVEVVTRMAGPPSADPHRGDAVERLHHAADALGATIRRSIERERTFTRYASHELRTPLSALKLQVERLRMGSAPVERVAPVLERNVQRMETVLRALQSLAQLSERETDPTPIESIMREVIASRSPADRERIVVGSLPEAALVTDAAIVRQALANLVDNALRHTDGRVSLAVHVQRTSLTLRVRDQGAGVPDDELPRLVEPFYRPATSTAPGIGLGLSLVEVIAQALDGELELRNTGTGLEATLRLPVAVDAHHAS